MAQLTWRNVEAPDFSGVAQSQQLASSLIANSLKGLGGAVADMQRTRNEAADAKALNETLRYSNVDDLNAALASGSISAGTADAARAIMAQRSTLLNDNARALQNTGLGIANSTNQFNLDTAKRDDGQAQARLAAQPAASKLLADVSNLTSTGDPAQIEQGRKLLADNTNLLVQAGWKADAIPGLIDTARSSGKAAFGYNQDVISNTKLLESQGISKEAQAAAFKQINANMTPEAAAQAIQNDRSITDPRIKAQAIQLIGQSADAKVFAQPDPTQVLLSSLGVQPGSVVQTQAAAATSPRIGNALVDLVDRTEGGGRWDTLYGHAQRKNSPFAGVNVSTMTLDQLSELDKSYGPYVKEQLAKQGHEPRIATPMGRFQIVGDTRRQAAKEMGLPGNTVFTPEVQVAMFNHLADKRLAGPKTMSGKMASLREEWEGFKSVKDNVLAAAITAYENGDKGALTGAGSSPVDAPAYPQQVAQAPGITMPVGSSQGAQLAAAAAPAPNSETFSNGDQYYGIAKTTSRLGRAIAEREEAAKTEAATAPADVPVTGFNLPSKAGIRGAIVPEAAAAQPNQAAQLAQTAAPQQAGATPGEQVQTALDTSAIDRVFNGNGALIAQITNPQFADQTAAQVANRLVAEDGLMPGGNKQAVLEAINQTIKMAGGNLSPNVAGALVANNAESRDLSSILDWVLPGSWVNGDRFSTKDENYNSATRTNMEGVKADLEQLGKNVGSSIDISKGVAQIQNQRASAVGQAQLAQVQQALQTVQQQAAALQLAIGSGQDTPENRAALQQKLGQIQQLQLVINQIARTPGPTTIFSGAANGTPR